MTKIAIITDTHFGIRSDSKYMLDYQEEFYSKVFFPYLKMNSITTVFHLGDLFDRRKYINYVTLHRTREMFLDPLKYNGMKLYIIPGNHDTYFKDTNSINSLKELLFGYDNIRLIEDPTTFSFPYFNIGFVPWINDENKDHIFSWIKSLNNTPILAGHFEISGFEMYRGIENEHGIDRNIFSKFDQVWSGHFHHKSSKDNIHYLGAPMEFTFADCDDDRGFHVYDQEHNTLDFIKNPLVLYKKIYYNDDSEIQKAYFRSFDFSELKNKIIKVYVTKKTDPQLFEEFIDRIYNENIQSLSIHENYSNFMSDEDTSSIEEVEKQTTKQLIDGYIDSINTDMNKNKLKDMMNTLYVEAIHQYNSNNS